MTSPPSIVWFRQDLRLDDNPALLAGLAHHRPSAAQAHSRPPAALVYGRAVVPVFIWDPQAEGDWAPGAASRCWLHGSLRNLDAALRTKGSRLVIRQGDSLNTLLDLIDKSGAKAVFWNRRYEPALLDRDRQIEATLGDRGIHVETFNSLLLFEPWTVETRSSTPYKVFTPFYRACRELPEPELPTAAPSAIVSPDVGHDSLELESLRLLPRIPWDAGIERTWKRDEAVDAPPFEEFVHHALEAYPDARNRPDLEGTSRVSPYLHSGELSPRRLWHAVRAAERRHGRATYRRAAEAYLRQLVWREFAYHLLFHFPESVSEPLNPAFANVRWRDDPRALKAWQQGRTGYPIVDAGMRQLWTTGWMHNRVRMLVGSFLVKDPLLPWQEGAKWFWDTLVDADLANNSLGWQWVAGCGADAAPFFRIFNPVRQGEQFDPHGDYVRQWVPELARLPDRWIHKPWQAPVAVLEEAAVELGNSYPQPLVDHAQSRARALESFRESRENSE